MLKFARLYTNKNMGETMPYGICIRACIFVSARLVQVCFSRRALRAAAVVLAFVGAPAFAQVNLAVSVPVGGSVAISPSGINCRATVCSPVIAPGTQVTLTV